MIQCKLCGEPLTTQFEVLKHRRNYHSWYNGETIIKKTKI